MGAPNQNKSLDKLPSLNESSNKGPVMKLILVAIFAVLIFFGISALTGTNEPDESDNNVEPTAEVVATDVPNDNEVEVTATVEPTEVESDEPAADMPENFEAIEIESLNYTVYRPNNWYFRLFGGTTLGMDPNPIPEVGEYAGAITITETGGTLEAAMNTYAGSLTGKNESTKTYASGEWTIVTGTRPASEISDAETVRQAYMKSGDYVYIIEYHYAAGGSATYGDIFENIVEFIEI